MLKTFGSILVLLVLYAILALIGEAGLAVKHDRIHRQVQYALNATPYDDCEAMRLIRAEMNVTADMGFNAFHEFSQWNRDYITEQAICRSEASR